jgi:hypothetical protein
LDAGLDVGLVAGLDAGLDAGFEADRDSGDTVSFDVTEAGPSSSRGRFLVETAAVIGRLSSLTEAASVERCLRISK